MRRRKNLGYIIIETILEVLLIIASWMIIFKFSLEQVGYSIIGITIIILVVISRVYVESKYHK